MPEFGTKIALFGYFWTRILENYCHISCHNSQICLIAKFHGKTKISRFGTKMPYLGIFDQKCTTWVFFGKKFFKKTIAIFEISTLEFV